MAKHTFGLQKVEMGPIAVDGDMGTVLEIVGETVAGSATLTMEDNTITDFNCEETDTPVESVVSQYGKMTFAWSSYDVSADQMVRFFGGTKTPAAAGKIATLGSITGGSSYTNGTYNNVPLTGGTGTGATANITVAGGAVTVVTIVNGGTGYAAANSLTASAANIGGTGTGFTVPVATVTTGPEKWEEPDVIPDIEVSLKLSDKKGTSFKMPRVKISAKKTFAFSKTALGQIDVIATVLQPSKVGVKKLTVEYP